MDGRGRCMDNVFIERLWRSLKYEAVYLHDLEDGFVAQRVIAQWIGFYNEQRPHSALAGRTPVPPRKPTVTPVGAHLDLQLLAVLTAVRAILVAAGRATAPLRLNVVCFDLHRQVCMLAPAMAWCPALLTAAPRRRRGCLSAGAPGSLLAAAPPRPPFPQPLAQFLELRTRRLQFAFQPLLSLYRLAMHSAVIARLPALL